GAVRARRPGHDCGPASAGDVLLEGLPLCLGLGLLEPGLVVRERGASAAPSATSACAAASPAAGQVPRAGRARTPPRRGPAADRQEALPRRHGDARAIPDTPTTSRRA